MRRAAFVFVIALAACPKPAAEPPPPSADASTPATAKAPARAHPLVRGQELGGPNATGRPGDWIIENDEVVFVIDGLGGGGGFAESGGNVLDAADAKTRKDELGQIFTYFGVFPRQAVYSAIDARSDADGSAVVVATGKELYEPDLDVVTEYRLVPGERALRLKTTLMNRSAKPILVPGVGDAIQWGGTEKIAPGQKPGFKGRTRGEFVGGVGRLASYAITSNESAMDAISGGAWTDTEQKKDVTIATGASVAYERAFLVGRRGDALSIDAELARFRGRPLGRVAFARAPRGVRIALSGDGGHSSNIVATSAESFEAEIPVGRWRVESTDIEVRAGAPTNVSLSFTVPKQSKLGPCTEDGRPVPCKLTLDGGKVDFGPSHVAGPAKNQITLLPGESVSVPLPDGKYVVTASRGPEYEIATKEIAAGEEASFALRRVIPTPGYIACDFHQHTVLSADSAVAMRDRVIANAAEGVEVAVATEHNVVADFSPIVKELGLSTFLVAIAGDELTSDASRKPWGHANVFPLPVDDAHARGGALPVRDRTPKVVFAEARALPGGPRVISINHPRTKANGYFELLGFDAKTGTSPDPGYDGTYDAMEIWSGRHIGARDHVLVDWFGLLRTNHPTTPIAATDTHGIVGQEAGYPRTYVRVMKDDALEKWSDNRTAEIVKAVRETRDVILTNGPFVTVTANGQGIGGIAKAGKGGAVELKVRIVTASWNAVDRAEIRRVRDEAPATIALSAPRTENGAIVREATHIFKTKEDDAFVVVVNGSSAMKPVLSGDTDETRPSAVTGPIWIDVDGDGKALGR